MGIFVLQLAQQRSHGYRLNTQSLASIHHSSVSVCVTVKLDAVLHVVCSQVWVSLWPGRHLDTRGIMHYCPYTVWAC